MKVYEFGEDKTENMLMFPCSLEPGWAFRKTAERMAEDFHVFFFVPDGHDEMGTDFMSIEKNVQEALDYLQKKSTRRLDLAYGVSMGGSGVMYLLANRMMPVKKAVIDAGITPYPYPKWVCRVLAGKDYLTTRLACSSMGIIKKAVPPARWTPEGEDPEVHYREVFSFLKNHISGKTIYNVFWSANNYRMPEPVPPVDTEMEYWYGEEERKARRKDLFYVKKAFPSASIKEHRGMLHAELVMMFPDRFHREIMRFHNAEQKGS